METSLIAKEKRIGRTIGVYYAFLTSLMAMQIGAFFLVYKIGPSHHYLRDPLFLSIATRAVLLMVLFPPMAAMIAVIIRRHERRTRWVLSDNGIHIIRDNTPLHFYDWDKISGVTCGSNIMIISVRGTLWPIVLTGIDRIAGREFARLAKAHMNDGLGSHST